MRFTQVSRQSFVGIVVLEQELGPRPLPLSLAVFCGLTESQIVEMIPCYFASFGEPSRSVIQVLEARATSCAARQRCRIRRGPRFYRHEPFSLQREALPSEPAAES